MKYLIAIIILIFNLINYQYPTNSAIYLAIHIILFITLIITERKKNKLFILIEAMIISWPISWINILGSSTETLQLPWYYIFGLFSAVLIFLNKNKGTILYGKKHIIIMYLFLLVYAVVPLVLAHDFIDGLGDYIMIMFYIVIMFLAYTSNYKLSEEDIEQLKTMFIFINLICAIGIIFQYVMFKYMGIALFKLGRSGSFSGENQISCSLLFEDTSCSTIMLGCGAMYSLIRAMRGYNKKYYFITLVIVLGLALTSRRTSVISLIIILGPYFVLSKQSNIKKMLSILLLPIMVLIVLYFLSLSRPVDNYSQYMNDTGRFADYISGIDVALKNPLGVGYGDTYLATLMEGNNIIPHNTILRWLDIGGVFLAIPLIVILISICNMSRGKMNADFWVLMYVFIASNFIPDILNSRFLILICLFVLLKKVKENEINEY